MLVCAFCATMVASTNSRPGQWSAAWSTQLSEWKTLAIRSASSLSQPWQ